MKWEKSPPELVALFEDVVPVPPAEKRRMFGYPAAFVNGNMFMGLHQHNLVLRLPDDVREAFQAREGAAPFEPMPGRPMREYVVVPPGVLANRRRLSSWVERSLAYVAALPPKAPKPRKKAPSR